MSMSFQMLESQKVSQVNNGVKTVEQDSNTAISEDEGLEENVDADLDDDEATVRIMLKAW